MPTRFVQEGGSKHRVNGRDFELLWGDPCHVQKTSRGRSEVIARGRRGTVPASDLGPDPRLLELYVIDVGQGDGVLMKTPDGKWHLIDAGIEAERQMTKKGAANFIRWKFFNDLRKRAVTLESVTMSHPDYDHYGGLIDVLGGSVPAGGGLPARSFRVEVENFYHPGMGRFAGRNPLGRKAQGTVDPFPQGDHGIRERGTFITELLDGKGHFRRPRRAFTSQFSELARLVGRVPKRVTRISTEDGHMPGYGPGEEVEIHVLGPVVERFGRGRRRGLRTLGGQSKSRNGHSVVYRVDYGNCRLLLTGDLNEKSQKLLLSYVPEREYASDVAKGCHHGSDDIDLGFIRAMAARATVISSGDTEDYAHPRPRVMGASAHYGREGLGPRNEPVPPLLYSTELARSVKLGYAQRVRVDDSGTVETHAPTRVDVRETSRAGYRDLERTPISLDLVYGLVNVRTDGRRILIATLEEQGTDFDKRVLQAGRSPR